MATAAAAAKTKTYLTITYRRHQSIACPWAQNHNNNNKHGVLLVEVNHKCRTAVCVKRDTHLQETKHNNKVRKYTEHKTKAGRCGDRRAGRQAPSPPPPPLTASALEVKEPDVFPLVMTRPPTRSSVVTFPRFHSLSPAASPASSLRTDVFVAVGISICGRSTEKESKRTQNSSALGEKNP